MTSLTASLTILAQQAAPAAAPAQQGPTGMQQFLSLLPMILIFVAMYFLLIAPQRKKQKETQKMLAALDTGDQVLTVGGIYGEITNKKDDRFVVRIAENIKIEVGKGYIQSVVKKADAAK